MNELGPGALLDAALTIATWIAVTLLAAGAGSGLLAILHVRAQGPAFTWLLRGALGMGVLGSLLALLGLLGIFSPATIYLLLLTIAAIASRPITDAAGYLLRVPAQLLRMWARSPWLPRLALLTLCATWSMAFLQALTPPWDYDGLMYHLVGPRLFLEAGRILPVAEHWHVNGPFVVEMLFAIGVAVGDDILPKLIHLTFGMMLTAATWVCGKRWLAPGIGWLAAVILLGVPTLTVWASFAYIDLGWALFEMMALVAIIEWQREGDRKWLLLAGLFAGMAMGSKYIAILGFALQAAAICLSAYRAGWRKALGDVARFIFPALLLAAPWYLKNALWFGNPVFPQLFGGGEWTADRLHNYTAYLNSFGAGRSLPALLALPWNLYARHELFGTVMKQIDIPSLLFLVLVFYPFMQRNRIVTLLLAFSLARVILWFFGSQQVRFLLPVMPWLALGSAYVIVHMKRSLGGVRLRLWSLWQPLAVGVAAMPLLLHVGMLLQFRTPQVVLGLQSKDDFLHPRVKEYGLARQFELEREAAGKALLLGVGRSYYCPTACVTDPDHFRWAAEIATLTACSDFAGRMQESGITRVVLSWEDLDFLLEHDPDGVMQAALATLTELHDTGCLRQTYGDDWIVVYELASPGIDPGSPALRLPGSSRQAVPQRPAPQRGQDRMGN